MRNQYLFLILLMLTIWGCGREPNSNKENETQSTEQTTELNAENKEAQTQTLAKLPQESKERIQKGDATIISLFDSEIATGEHQPLLEKLFPGGTITPANATELVDAFDISLNNENYCVLITYAQAPGGYFVIDKFYVFKQAFNVSLLNQINN